MVKINRNRIICFFFTLLICLSFTFSVIPASAYADNIVDFDNTNVLDDLRSSPNFNLLKYPAVPMEKSMLVINFVEYCYSFDIHRQNNYGLYIYIYNPSQIDLDTSDGANKVQMATVYDENGKPTCYEKFDLKFCSVSNEKFYEKLFYKFKIIDHKGQYGKTMLQRVKSSERRYDISGIEMLEKGKTLPIDYGVGGTYKFSGYATGFGADTRENTLTCAVTELETIQLEVHKTNFRTGEYKTNHRHDLTSVYFSVPQKFFDNYGSLQKIKAEWYEYKTSPVVVTSNSTVYSGLINQIGVSTNNNLQRISLYSGYQELVGASGHYNKYNFGYNVVGEVNDRLDTLNYVFSTNGSDISKYVLTSSRLQSYIESYTKTYANGKIEIPGKTLSADLFESGLDSNRRNVA